jgi:diguanylate cyclase (GGDEF)-like protein
MNLRLRDSLRMQTLIDPLTQLYNRRFLLEFMEKELTKAARNESSIGVCMIDVDHFKQFNDIYGHDAGDAVLREFGLFLKNGLRASDVACRYGGEEFAVLLPDIARPELEKRVQSWCESVRALRVTHLKTQLGTISISIGVALAPAHGMTAEALLKAADKALYLAKKNGRDRIEFAV